MGTDGTNPYFIENPPEWDPAGSSSTFPSPEVPRRRPSRPVRQPTGWPWGAAPRLLLAQRRQHDRRHCGPLALLREVLANLGSTLESGAAEGGGWIAKDAKQDRGRGEGVEGLARRALAMLPRMLTSASKPGSTVREPRWVRPRRAALAGRARREAQHQRESVSAQSPRPRSDPRRSPACAAALSASDGRRVSSGRFLACSAFPRRRSSPATAATTS